MWEVEVNARGKLLYQTLTKGSKDLQYSSQNDQSIKFSFETNGMKWSPSKWWRIGSGFSFSWDRLRRKVSRDVIVECSIAVTQLLACSHTVWPHGLETVMHWLIAATTRTHLPGQGVPHRGIDLQGSNRSHIQLHKSSDCNAAPSSSTSHDPQSWYCGSRAKDEARLKSCNDFQFTLEFPSSTPRCSAPGTRPGSTTPAWATPGDLSSSTTRAGGTIAPLKNKADIWYFKVDVDRDHERRVWMCGGQAARHLPQDRKDCRMD